MRRRTLVTTASLLAAAGLACGVPSCSERPQRSQRLNVLFVTVDTLRADHLGCYGYERDTSPRIDGLARDGVLFSQGIVQWPKTTPSFASMLTSTYAWYNGVQRAVMQPVSGRFDLLAEVMKKGGYETAGVVTNPNLARLYHFDQGFDTYVEAWRELKPARAEEVTAWALDWLRERVARPRPGPFFLWLHYIDPHGPYTPPPPYRDRYVNDEHYDGTRRAALNEGDWEGVGGIPKVVQVEDPSSPGKIRDEVDYYVALYDAEIHYMDESIGKVLDAVVELGLADDTMIVFTADHGESLGEHDYYFEHGVLPYDACSRVPLIFEVPGMKARASAFAEPVQLIDVMPTILDVVGLPAPEAAQGRSLLPFMTEDASRVARYAFTESGYAEDYQRSIRRDHWKLIHAPSESDQVMMRGVPFELYDVEADPHETHNLIDVETVIADELKRELLAWIAAAKPAPELDATGEVSIDAQTQEALRQLGYAK